MKNIFKTFTLLFFLLFTLFYTNAQDADKGMEQFEALKEQAMKEGQGILDELKEKGSEYTDKADEYKQAGLNKMSEYKEKLDSIKKFFEGKKYNEGAFKVAIIPFDYTSEIRAEESQWAFYETAEWLKRSTMFEPLSLEKWIDNEISSGQFNNMQEIIDRAIQQKQEFDFICTGLIFKCNGKVGLKIALYPLDGTTSPSFYFRDFYNIYSLDMPVKDIVSEMEKRALKTLPIKMTNIEFERDIINKIQSEKDLEVIKSAYKQDELKMNYSIDSGISADQLKLLKAILYDIGYGKELFKDKKISIRKFDVKISQYDENKEGNFQKSELGYMKYKGTEYRTTDNFFNEILQYNMHISNLFALEHTNINTNKKRYIKQSPDIPADSNYQMRGLLDISKKTTLLTIYVDKISKVEVENKNSRNKKNNSKIETVIKLVYSKTYAVKDFSIDSLYKLSRDISKDVAFGILNPEELQKVGVIDIDSFISKEKLYCNDYYIGRGNQKNLAIPLTSPIINTSFTKHWKYPAVDQLTGLQTDGYSILQNGNNKLKRKPFLFLAGGSYNQLLINDQLFFGGSANFSFENKYFSLMTELGIKYNKDSNSIITDLSFTPCFVIPPTDSRFRPYVGLGLFFSFWLNNLFETYYTEAPTASNPASYIENLAVRSSDSYSVFCSIGLAPEIGFMVKFAKFCLRIGTAYNFDLSQINIVTTSGFSGYNGTNTSGFVAKVSFGYYIN